MSQLAQLLVGFVVMVGAGAGCGGDALRVPEPRPRAAPSPIDAGRARAVVLSLADHPAGIDQLVDRAAGLVILAVVPDGGPGQHEPRAERLCGSAVEAAAHELAAEWVGPRGKIARSVAAGLLDCAASREGAVCHMGGETEGSSAIALHFSSSGTLTAVIASDVAGVTDSGRVEQSERLDRALQTVARLRCPDPLPRE
ncbi:hypothetical protein BH11MYX1_BH11MYX1_44170 [soil metagenome]